MPGWMLSVQGFFLEELSTIQFFFNVHLLHFASVLLKRDLHEQKSRGFGFITFENPADAEEAVKQLDRTVSNQYKFHTPQFLMKWHMQTV